MEDHCHQELDDGQHDMRDDRIASLLRQSMLCIVPVAMLHALALDDYVTGCIRALWLVILAFSPATMKRYVLYLRLSVYAILPSRYILAHMGLVWHGDIFFLVFAHCSSLFLHASMTAHLIDILFVNVLVIYNASTLFVCLLSVVVMMLSIALARIKYDDGKFSWLMNANGRSDVTVSGHTSGFFLCLALAGGCAAIAAQVFNDCLDVVWHTAHQHEDAVRQSLVCVSALGFAGSNIYFFLHRDADPQQTPPCGDTLAPVSKCTTMLDLLLKSKSLQGQQRAAIIEAQRLLCVVDLAEIEHRVELGSASSFPAGNGNGSVTQAWKASADLGSQMDVCALDLTSEPSAGVKLHQPYTEDAGAAQTLVALMRTSQSDDMSHISQDSVQASAETPPGLPPDQDHNNSTQVYFTYRYENLCHLSFDAMAVLEVEIDQHGLEHTTLVWWNTAFSEISTKVGNGDLVRGSYELERRVLTSCMPDAVHNFELSTTRVELQSKCRRIWMDRQNSLICWVMHQHSVDQN